MAENQDVNTLKRRGRRRLVGAIALVLLAVIVLPMVFDSEPRDSAPPVSVRIPGEDETGFAPKVTPRSSPVPEQKAPASSPASAPVVEKTAGQAPEAQPEKPAPKAQITVTKGSDKPAARTDAEQRRAEAALAGGQFMIPAGAYADPAGVIEKLKQAKIPFYTEPIATKQGTVTRVRAGPFASRDAADKVLQQLKDLGLKPGNVATRS
jgi:DedD protein